MLYWWYTCLNGSSQDSSESLTHGVSELQDYEVALAEAERALLNVAQQLTSYGALPEATTSSLAENQQYLAKHQVKYRQTWWLYYHTSRRSMDIYSKLQYILCFCASWYTMKLIYSKENHVFCLITVKIAMLWKHINSVLYTYFIFKS